MAKTAPTPLSVTQVRQRMEALQDIKYQNFHSSLVPGCGNVLGVRMPLLRRLAKEFLAESSGFAWESYLDYVLDKQNKSYQDKYYEEAVLQALFIAAGKMSLAERFERIRAFVPKISNWAVCDLFCSSLKEARKYPQEYWQLILTYYDSSQPYEIRFAAVMTLDYFTDSAYAGQAIKLLANVRHSSKEEYYVKMAVAWALSVFFVKQRELTLALLQNPDNGLDKFTHNKALQKMRESFRVTAADKALIKSLKR